jgi:hypothetical protein
MGKQQSEKHIFASKTVNNKRYMICRNSEADGKYWQGKLCDEWSKVGMNTTSVLCHKCSARIAGDPEVGAGYKSSGKPRGWQFMKEYVDEQGNVFHKGEEQPKLKGTLPPTQIDTESSKKRLTKQEKQELRDQLLQQVVFLRGNISKATLKKDINSNKTQLRKLERQLKKIK